MKNLNMNHFSNIGPRHSRTRRAAWPCWAAVVTALAVLLALPMLGPGAAQAANAPRIPNVAAGHDHTVGLKGDGTVVAAGGNAYGQCNVAGWSNLVAVAAGSYHTVGLKADGTAVAVGENGAGQCNVSGWRNVVAVAAGGSRTVGLKADGTLVAAGDNGAGQCNVTGWRGIVAVAGGGSHTVGLKADGTVVAVGTDDWGQCDVTGWSGVVTVAASERHTLGLKADGTVLAVGPTGPSGSGWPNYGQCNVADWSNIVAVAAGGYHTVGVKADGTVIAVGADDWGQCDVTAWNLGVTPADGFASWTIARRLPVLLRGPADRNGPLGLPNLVAYGLGLNPFTAQSEDLPSLTLRETGGVVTVAFTYRRSKTATGIDVQVVGTTTLPVGPWEPVNVAPLRLGYTPDGQAELWQMEFPADVPARFFQLRVVQP